MTREDDGQGGPGFPGTRLSLLEDVTSEDAARRRLGQERLVAAYWRPVYLHLRLRLRRTDEDARDLTQGFFAAALERGYFTRFDAGRGRFRTFLRTCVDRFAGNEARDGRALRRGGDRAHDSLDFADAERQIAARPGPADGSPDEAFEREWRRGVFSRALAAFEAECREGGRSRRFEVFRRYDLADAGARPRYEDVARELEIPVTVVTNEIHQARQRLRALLVGLLEAETATRREFEEDLAALLGGGLA